MQATIGPSPPLLRLEGLAKRAGCLDILAQLRAVSLEPDTTKFVGVLVSFLANRERIGILFSWAEDCVLAGALARLGRAAWNEADLLRELRPIGDEHRVSEVLHGSQVSHYLAAMAAARRALPNDRLSAWIERLRLMLFIRAMEAGKSGVFRERNLRDVCAKVRLICDSTDSPKRTLLEPISHKAEDWEDFVGATRIRCGLELARLTSPDDAEARQLWRQLSRILVKDWTALPDTDAPVAETPAPAAASAPPIVDSQETSGAKDDAELMPEADGSGRGVHCLTGTDGSVCLVVTEINDSRPPPAQRHESTGVVLQTLEETQYLRHSWHRLSVAEEAAFLQRTVCLLATGTPRDRLGASMVSLSVLSSTPLSALHGMLLRQDRRGDWWLDLHHGQLKRSPPRFARRWRAYGAGGPKAGGWVRLLAPSWDFELSEQLLRPLRDAKSRGAGSQKLGDLWQAASADQTIEAWFSQVFAVNVELERLTAPVVSTVLSQRAFEGSSDHTLARLVGSRSRTGLPSACTYGSFDANEVRRAVASHVQAELAALAAPSASDTTNAAGSELDVDLPRLRRAVDGLVRKVNAAAKVPGLWVEHHNRLTALCVLTLLASTGARPVTSPFESLAWIDFELRILYVEDKHSGPTRGSRLCVLSDVASDLLQQRYLPHLERLASALRTAAPEFAAEIDKVRTRDVESRLPLFFMLREKPPMDWMEVSESQMDIVCESPWPLPWNFLRHVHSTQLRRWGLHPEIRDALLAHGDQGAESHGDFSWRVPHDDLETARHLVNQLAQALGLSLPVEAVHLRPIEARGLGETGFSVSRPFGRKARDERREHHQESARAVAENDIEAAVGGRPLDSLSANDWERISRAVLFRKSGLPHSMASLRYEVFEEYLTSHWRERGAHSRLRRRNVPVRESHGLFTEDAIGAAGRLDAWRQRFEAVVTAMPARTLGPVLRACLAALDLVLYARVDNLSALCALARCLDTVKVIHFQKRDWFEWSYRGKWNDGRPVYRVPMSARAAEWTSCALESSKQLKEVPLVPAALQGLCPGGDADFESLLEQLTTLVSQLNAFELPGAMAAFLSGRRECAALPHGDWIRTTLLMAPAQDDESPPAGARTEPVDDAAEHFFRHYHKATRHSEPGSEVRRCRELFVAVRKLLEDAGQTHAARLAGISRAVDASGFARGDAPNVLAQYLGYLLKRPKKSHAGRTLKSSTALRYWQSLAGGFLDFAADVNLTGLDEEEMTDLYAQIAGAAQSSPETEAAAAADGRRGASSRRRRTLSDSDARNRTLSQLEAFHKFAQHRYGLEDPDWSEIAPGRAVGTGRPGIVLLAEYQVALNLLLGCTSLAAADDDRVGAAFVLLACARFGLRIGEAVGLQRSDWADAVGTVVVLVRSNSIRSLKTVQSKRQVPLVGDFNPLERAVIDETLRRWDHREGRNRATALLAVEVAGSFRLLKTRVSVTLLPLVKAVTRNPGSTVHHLRHGFASRLLALLSARTMGAGLRVTEPEALAARRLLLGTDLPDRRTLWSVARMLGHASPAMTMKAYAHVFDAWIPGPESPLAADTAPRRRPLVDLDARAQGCDAGYLNLDIPPRAEEPPSEPLLLRNFRYLRLRAFDHRSPTTSAQLDKAQAMQLESNLERAARRLAPVKGIIPGASELLAAISVPRWKSLVDLVEGSRPVGDTRADEGDWIYTVGANRQIVLFLPAHFVAASAFMRTLTLTPEDCAVVHIDDLDAEVRQEMEAAGLGPYLVTRTGWVGEKKYFQVDQAVLGPRKVTHKDRAALVPRQGGRVVITQAMLVLWIAWCST